MLLRLESGKICKNKITQVCFIALTLAGSLGRCLNTRPNGLVFKQLPGDSANEENMCDPYNLNPLPTGKFCVFFCCLLRFFSKSTFLKNSCKIPSECQTVWVQIRPDVLSGLIWVQIVFKWYQQMALVDKKLISTHHSVSVGLDTFCFSNSY